MPDDAPAQIRAYAERAVGAVPPPSEVRITQEGVMWPRPGGRSMRFTAVQTFAVDRVAFAWRARFPVLGPLALHVVDRVADDEGELTVRLLGIPVQRQRGPETAVGEALRYLAELPWVPHAMRENRALEWAAPGHGGVEVATRVRGRRVAVELAFDEHGDVTGAATRSRPRKVGRDWAEASWGGVFGDHGTVGGLRVPRSAEAFWETPRGREVYFRARVTSVVPVDATSSG